MNLRLKSGSSTTKNYTQTFMTGFASRSSKSAVQTIILVHNANLVQVYCLILSVILMESARYTSFTFYVLYCFDFQAIKEFQFYNRAQEQEKEMVNVSVIKATLERFAYNARVASTNHTKMTKKFYAQLVIDRAKTPALKLDRKVVWRVMMDG